MAEYTPMPEQIERLEIEVGRLRAELEQSQARVRELEEALREIAESHDAGRHDGLPEPCPAHDSVYMWSLANEALANSEKELDHD